MGIRYRGNGICHMGVIHESANRAHAPVEGVECDAMTNPLVHALVFLAALLIPGGLLVYFGWRAVSLKEEPNRTAQFPGKEDIPADVRPTPLEARIAFQDRFPKESLRARNRRQKLERARVLRRRRYRK